MKEELISFETAKLAKEKGFCEPCQLIYVNGNYRHKNLEIGDIYDNGISSTQIPRDWLLAPTQSLLQKWLREVHKINVESNYLPNIEKYGCLYIPMTGKAKRSDIKFVHKIYYNTYEEAFEIGLQESLKLIK